MKTLLRYCSVFWLLLVPVLLPNLTAAAQDNPRGEGSPELFASAAAPAWRAQNTEPTLVRNRLVYVNFNALGDIHTPAGAVVLNLFEDVTFAALFDRTETNGLGSFVWTGHLEGVEYGHAVLVVTNGLLAGSVSMPGASYQVAHAGGGVYAVQEIDQSAFPPELEPIPADPAWDEPITEDLGVMPDSCDQITVLVAYSPEARAADGGTAQIESRIALAVAETNQSYVNSGLTQRLVLVHTMETDPGDAANNFNTDLYALQNLSDGIFDNVDAAREAYYADEVALIIENSSSCGLGYLNSTAAWAFSVTHRTCATGYYSFGHELGHNMGARHDWYVDDAANYHKGFVNLADSWRTIMAYNQLCSDQGGYCSRLQYWSNPDVTYGSPPDPMGVISTGPMNCVGGSLTPDPSSCAADNRTRLNNTCSAVANFRSTPQAPEIDVQGNGVSIADGDNTPSGADDTDFGSVDAGSPAVGHTFTIENTGDGDLNLAGSPRVTVSGTHAADFSVSAQPATPVAGGGGTITFTVNFAPTVVGLRSATISIANDDTDEHPYDFDIQGTGTQPPGTGTIIVEKQTARDGSTETFEFSTDYGPNFTLSDDGTNNSGPLTAGTYSVSEINLPARWSLTSAICDDDSDPSAIGLDDGETVTCVFTNTREPTTLAPVIMILTDEEKKK